MEQEEILQYVKNVYGTEPEYIWQEHPTCAVLRIKDTGEWYGVLMNITKEEIGMEGEGKVEILNVRCAPEMEAVLLDEKGFFPGYLMEQEEWNSIVLDGRIGEIKILDLLDKSYEFTENIRK